MPPLPRPAERHTLTLPPRQALWGGETDVLVVGGGPAGLGAAYGAATAGAKVILAERYGFLGGNATAALVMPLMSFHTQSPVTTPAKTRLLPNDHGPGRPVVVGALQVFLERLVRAGGAIPPSLETGYVVPFDPEIFKLTALDLLDDAGVQFLLHAFASDVVSSQFSVLSSQFSADNSPSTVNCLQVVFETKSGPVVLGANVVIDCTGDGDVAARAGAAYEVGREEDGLVQPMTLMFRMVEFRYEAFERYVQEHPGQWRGVYGLWDLIRQAAQAGELKLFREDLLFFGTPHEQEVAVNSTRVIRVLGTDVWDLTYAEAEGRRQMRQIAAFLNRYVPGFEQAYVAQSGVQIGVRETRRILGEYRLTADDLLSARKFEDGIARGAYPLDIHNPTGRGTILRRLPPGESYDIPLRCLIPRTLDADRQAFVGREAHCVAGILPACVEGVPPSNRGPEALGTAGARARDTTSRATVARSTSMLDRLLVAGRCISGTHEANSSYRTMPTSMATGQAAGVCAALAVRAGVRPRKVPAPSVQAELLRQGANLG
jgi:hypothetical protein